MKLHPLLGPRGRRRETEKEREKVKDIHPMPLGSQLQSERKLSPPHNFRLLHFLRAVTFVAATLDCLGAETQESGKKKSDFIILLSIRRPLFCSLSQNQRDSPGAIFVYTMTISGLGAVWGLDHEIREEKKW